MYAVPVLFFVAAKVQPCLLITDIPCMVAPIAGSRHPGLLEERGGALPRTAEGQVCLKELQHIGARPHDFPDLHEVKVHPGGFPSATAPSASGANSGQPVVTDQPFHTVYAAYAAGQPMPGVQPHLDFRALLLRAGDVVEGNREIQAAAEAEGGASGVSDWSSSPKRISELAGSTLNALHKKGWHAMTLFEVVVLYALWFQAAGSAAPVDEGQGPAPGPAPRPATGVQGDGRVGAPEPAPGVGPGVEPVGADDAPPVRDMTKLSRSEFLMISTHLMEVLRVAIGSTGGTGGTGLSMMTLPHFMSEDVLTEEGAGDNMEEGAGETTPTRVLREVGAVVDLYH